VTRADADAEALSGAGQWWTGLADALAEIGRRVGRLSAEITQDWPDGRGQEWVERTAHLGHDLGREARAAAELGESYARQAADPYRWDPPPARHTGVRLGSTEARRTDDERGMRIAELPD
jgi:hypothetical protein